MAITKPPKVSGGAPAVKPVNILNFKRGFNSFLDNVRRDPNSLDKADNLMLVQDGIPKNRWGTRNYGDEIPGEVCDGDSTFSKYNRETGLIEDWLISVVDGKVFVSRTGKNWKEVAGDKLEIGHEVSFLNIENKVFISNGHDNMTFYDIEANEVFRYTPLSTPSAPKCVRQGALTDGNITLNYRITAVNDVGETKASLGGTVKVNKQRDTWVNDGSKTEAIKLDWDAVFGASRYNIYYSDEAGQEIYIDSIAANTYLDDARMAANMAIAAPLDDTTGGPIVSVLAYSDNRIWGTGDPDNPYRVYFGGVGAMTTAFSPFYGGGWVDIAKGGSEFPTIIQSYRDGKGETNNTLFMSGANGEGSQYQITLSSMSVGTTSFIVPLVGRVIGSLGTSARYGVVECKNNLFYPSVNSFNTTGAKPDMLNVLSTDEISLSIRPNVRKIGARNARLIATTYYDGKIFWAVANGGTFNNEIWVLDTELQAWMLPWKLPVKYFISHTDESGVERLLFRPSTKTDKRFSGKHLVELAPRFMDDNGTLFDTHLSTGLISFDPSHMSFAKVKKVYFELLECFGELDIQVSGTMKNKKYQGLKTFKIKRQNTIAGFDAQLWDNFLWDSTPTAPKLVLPETLKKVLKIRKTLNNIKIEIKGKSNSAYTLSGISIHEQAKKVGDPGEWKR